MNKQTTLRHSERGFTLMEILVIFVVISILAALVLPSHSKVKQRTRLVTCLNNLRQIDVALKLYISDNDHSLPNGLRLNKNGFADRRYLIGGKDGSVCGKSGSPYELIPKAIDRPLFPYLQAFEAFRCPADRGLHFPEYPLEPTVFEAAGCSYGYNMDHGPHEWPKHEPLRRLRDSSVGNPALFIVMFEHPALPVGGWVGNGRMQSFFSHWHEAAGPTFISEGKLAEDSQRFISPILFLDGHAARHDFTQSIKSGKPYASTASWTWSEESK